MIRSTLYTLVLCLTLWTGCASAAQGIDREKTAVAAAEKWLALVDTGKYGESWKDAAGYFRNSVTLEKWEQVLQGVRFPLGKLASRKVKSSTYQTSLPGMPDGEYVVVLFDTSFGNKKSSTETVTPMREKDGSWRVSGYYIR